MKAPAWLGIEVIAVSGKEKLVATLGGVLGIALLMNLSAAVLPLPAAAAVVASMGASAVLLFGVPHGALSQPWPLVGGHLVSAVIGVCCARWVPQPTLAAGLAVGLSIGAMHQLRCIHPPGGATALVAVVGGEAIRGLGFGYVLFPVAANALSMLLLAGVLNAPFRWRLYPASLAARHPGPRPGPPASGRPTHEEVVEAVRSLDSFVDISEEDLLFLVERLSDRRDAGGASVRSDATPGRRPGRA